MRRGVGRRKLRRIVRLMTLNIKPVFVFDGVTPQIKRRTVAARRARREKSSAKLRKVVRVSAA